MHISYGNDLRDGSMYGQALATIALCEAYGMTHDPALREAGPGRTRLHRLLPGPARRRLAIQPRRAGRHDRHRLDAHGAEERADGPAARASPAIFLAERFLSSVQNEDGSRYGYMIAQAAADDHGRRTALPHVHRLAARQPGPGPRAWPTSALGAVGRQSLLRLLRDPGDVPLGRTAVGRVEPEDARVAHHEPRAARGTGRAVGTSPAITARRAAGSTTRPWPP